MSDIDRCLLAEQETLLRLLNGVRLLEGGQAWHEAARAEVEKGVEAWDRCREAIKQGRTEDAVIAMAALKRAEQNAEAYLALRAGLKVQAELEKRNRFRRRLSASSKPANAAKREKVHAFHAKLVEATPKAQPGQAAEPGRLGRLLRRHRHLLGMLRHVLSRSQSARAGDPRHTLASVPVRGCHTRRLVSD